MGALALGKEAVVIGGEADIVAVGMGLRRQLGVLFGWEGGMCKGPGVGWGEA